MKLPKGHTILIKGFTFQNREVHGLLLFTFYLVEVSEFVTMNIVGFMSFKTKGNPDVEGLEGRQDWCPCPGLSDSGKKLSAVHLRGKKEGQE